MTTAAVKVILCDLGNVLLHFDHRIAVRRIQPHCDKSFDEIYQLFFDSPFTKDYEEGRISSSDFFKHMTGALAARDLAYEDFCAAWSDIFFDSGEMLAWLRELKKDFRLHLVSNINELHYAFIRKNFSDHIAVFDDIFLSYEIGHRKPHQEIYDRAIRASGFDVSQCLYIDDREDLVAAARQMGIRSVVFRGVAACRQELKEMGIWPQKKTSS
jgi:putative hydrolase of the HAD superfamily